MSGSTKKPNLRRVVQTQSIPTDALLGALPHPLLVIGEGLTIEYANTAAEDFFQMSAGVLCRRTHRRGRLRQPSHRSRRAGAAKRHHGQRIRVDLGSFRFEAPKLVDLYGGPVAEMPWGAC